MTARTETFGLRFTSTSSTNTAVSSARRHQRGKVHAADVVYAFDLPTVIFGDKAKADADMGKAVIVRPQVMGVM
jgi:hypothetical protein